VTDNQCATLVIIWNAHGRQTIHPFTASVCLILAAPVF